MKISGNIAEQMLSLYI